MEPRGRAILDAARTTLIFGDGVSGTVITEVPAINNEGIEVYQYSLYPDPSLKDWYGIIPERCKKNGLLYFETPRIEIIRILDDSSKKIKQAFRNFLGERTEYHRYYGEVTEKNIELQRTIKRMEIEREGYITAMKQLMEQGILSDKLKKELGEIIFEQFMNALAKVAKKS